MENNREETRRCLECGREIPSGRKDKKFCSVSCKSRYHYRAGFKPYRMKVLRAIDRNHRILDQLLAAGVTSVDLPDLAQMGYRLGYVTAYNRVRNRNECRCYDIKFYITESRIFGITRTTLDSQIAGCKL